MKNKLGISNLICACGCGENIIIYRRNLYRNPPKFISGHNLKFVERRPQSKETKEKTSKTKKELYRLGLLYIPSRKGIISPNRKGKMVICRICGKEFYNPIDREKEGKGIFCSRECYAIDQTKRKMPKETKMKISDAHVGNMPANNQRPGKFGNIKKAYYQINGKNIFFRSKWEANYALYLDFLVSQSKIIKWEYEVDVFIFEKIKFGTRSYRPDFKIFNNDKTVEYHEVKGWMDRKSKTKLNRMRIYYPAIKMRLVDGEAYKVIIKQLRGIIAWY